MDGIHVLRWLLSMIRDSLVMALIVAASAGRTWWAG